MKKLICTLFSLMVTLALPNSVYAEQPFIGEMRYFGGNYAPRGWQFCDGQLLQIAQHSALFSILGTIYGGDGRTTFALPDMRGRALMHAGTGPGLSPRRLGERTGVEGTTLNASTMSNHSHKVRVANGAADTASPNNVALAEERMFKAGTTANVPMDDTSISTSGRVAPAAIPNMQPSLVLNCIIATDGIFPSRS